MSLDGLSVSWVNYTAELHSLKTHNGAARRVVTSGAKMRAACPELEETRAACLYTAQLELGAHSEL